jgi:hypothetical protein
MGVSYDSARRKYVVRWSEDGRRRTRRFETEPEATAFLAALAPAPVGRPHSGIIPQQQASTGRRDGVYRYETRDGPRWRFVFVQSDGTRSSRRGFGSRGAALAEKRTSLKKSGVGCCSRIADLRTAVDSLPLHARGVCPMLAAHRNGARTDFMSFARAWDPRRGPRRLPATRRQVAISRRTWRRRSRRARGTVRRRARRDDRRAPGAAARPRGTRGGANRTRLAEPARAQRRRNVLKVIE